MGFNPFSLGRIDALTMSIKGLVFYQDGGAQQSMRK